MRSTEIVFFCSLYLLFFFMIGSLAGITTFPPPAQLIEVEIWELEFSFELSLLDTTLLLFIIALIVAGTFIAGIKIFGSGIHFDQAFVATIIAALFFGGLLAWIMSSMLVGVPIYVSAILVWPFIGILIYSIISMARGGTGG